MLPARDDPTSGGQERVALLAGVLGDLLLADAARLARRGRRAEAEAVLDVALALGLPDRAGALDLLARIWAQQGRWEDAAAAWAEALALAPGHTAYTAALRQRSRPGPLRARAWLVPVLGAVAVGLVIALGVVACRYWLR